MWILNQFSYIVIGLIGAGLLAGVMWRWHRPASAGRRFATLGMYGLALVAVVSLVQFPASNTTVESFSQIENTLDNGRPTFVMLYSHFCVSCIASLPTVQGLEGDVTAQGQEIDMIFLDIHTDLGTTARDRLGFSFSPTFILYDPTGREVLRGNDVPTSTEIAEALVGERGG